MPTQAVLWAPFPVALPGQLALHIVLEVAHSTDRHTDKTICTNNIFEVILSQSWYVLSLP